ncbi:Acetyltransferase [Rhodovulum sp. PH10]|nr:Acetyltransferase [Rhodovulum sp. PH10]
MDALDRYLATQASQDVKRRVSNCFVALDDAGLIAGYYTLAASSVLLTEMPPETAKRLPRYPLVPAALIGRLAVDRRFRRKGLGRALVMDAAVRAGGSDPAIFALLVDAKDDAAITFYRHNGFRSFASKPHCLFLPVATALQALQDDS